MVKDYPPPPPPPSTPPPPKKKKKNLLCFFAHLVILEYSDHHQNLISSLYYPGSFHKILSQSVHNVLSNVVHRQTDKLTNATKSITSFAKEVRTLTRSTWRVQNSLAEADHYSQIAHCKNVEPWWGKANPKGSGSLLTPRTGYASAIMVFLCSFIHLRIPRSPPTFNLLFTVLNRTTP